MFELISRQTFKLISIQCATLNMPISEQVTTEPLYYVVNVFSANLY